MSRVFVAEEVRFRRKVVVKVLSGEVAASLSAERFEREIQLTGQLQHPNIVPVLTAGESAGVPYYTMPFVKGASLRERLSESHRLSMDEATHILRDVAKALAYAHGQGVVHRDIKPENILLTDGTAVVTDFGIAKAISVSTTQARGLTLTATGANIGTPAYMAPEQAAGDQVDQRADIYAWGIIAYEMLAGAHPFSSKKSAQQIIAAHIGEQPPQLDKVAKNIPPVLSALVTRCLDKDPTKRPQSATELVSVLEHSGTGERRATPGRLKAGLVAASILAVLVAGVVGWRTTHPTVNNSIKLAVIPFENQGPPEQEYFADGLTDAVTGKLAPISGLTVIDRRSAATYKKTSKPIKQIGRELGIDYVLDGVVRWEKDPSGNWRAEVMPSLIRTADGAVQWSGERIGTTSADPFQAETAIAEKVVSALDIALATSEHTRLSAHPTDNPDAYEAYEQAVANEVRGVAGNAAQTRQLYERAVALDPHFAEAWARLAGWRQLDWQTAMGDTSKLNAFRDAAKQAITLRPDLGEAHGAWATYLFAIDSGAAGTLEIERGSRLAPWDARMLGSAGYVEIMEGREAEGLAKVHRAIALDPRNVENLEMGAISGQFLALPEEMERYAATELAINPDLIEPYGELLDAAIARHDIPLLRARLDTFSRAHPEREIEVKYAILAGGKYVARARRKAVHDLSASKPSTTPSDSLTNLMKDVSLFLAVGDKTTARVLATSALYVLTRGKAAPVTGPGYRILESRLDAILGRRQDAIRALRSLKPTTTLTYLYENARARGTAYALLGEADSAVAAYSEMIALRPRYARADWLFIRQVYAPAISSSPAYQALDRREMAK